MQTTLAPEYVNSASALIAQDLLRQCVHCGFCTATCPTYQLLGDELDGPRGRIYLIRQVLEGETPTQNTQTHLDRCLTCRSCESTCPSGVEYGHLLEAGRALVEDKVPRPWHERAVRSLLVYGLTSPLFAPSYRLGQWLRPLLPQVLQNKITPQRSPVSPAKRAPITLHTSTPLPLAGETVLLLEGCVQPTLTPNINPATRRVLTALGAHVITPTAGGCCAALAQHLGHLERAQAQIRRNIDAWWPHLQSGASTLISNASGCGVMVKDYGHVMRGDAQYSKKAQQVSELCRDLSELLPTWVPLLKTQLNSKSLKDWGPMVFHPPCTLQHGQKINGLVEQGLRELGFEITPGAQDAHLCCGSAGTYSVLQPVLSQALQKRKLAGLMARQPEQILSANVGCITHLQAASPVPVRHWIEVLDEALSQTSPEPEL
jgi:glycolate oxidase iron-sulfur subunit